MSLEFQTRSNNGSLDFFATLQEAWTRAKQGDIWKISYGDGANTCRWVIYTKKERYEKTIVTTSTLRDGKPIVVETKEEGLTNKELDHLCSLNETFKSLPNDDEKTIFWINQPLGKKPKDVLTETEFIVLVKNSIC